jgi:hypothetical protein
MQRDYPPDWAVSAKLILLLYCQDAFVFSYGYSSEAVTAYFAAEELALYLACSPWYSLLSRYKILVDNGI